jgi:hypothetical protein
MTRNIVKVDRDVLAKSTPIVSRVIPFEALTQCSGFG